MTEKPRNQRERDENEAEHRFNETLGRLVNTPHKPHKAKEGAAQKDGPKPSKG